MFLYTALGDSITAGDGAPSWAQAYPSLVVSMLEMRCSPATGEVLAQPGWTSATLQGTVVEHSAMYLTEAKTISIWVGGDDLAKAGIAVLGGAPPRVIEQSIVHYGKNIARLVLWVRKLSRATVILCTQYNPFPNSPVAAEGVSALNAVTAEVAGRLGTVLAPVHAWFEGQQSALIYGYRTGRLEDVLTSPQPPIHPNRQGHQVIASHLAPMVLQRDAQTT